MLEEVRSRLNLGALAPWLLLAAIAVLVLYPTYMLFYGSLWSSRPGFPGHFTVEHYIDTATSLDTYKVLLNSLIIITGKTMLAGAIAVYLAWLVTRTNVPYRAFVEIVAPLPFFVPGLLAAIGWAMLANPRNGTLNQLFAGAFGLEQGPFNIYSYGGIIFVMALHSASFVYLLIVAAFRNLDASLEESAHLSGADGWKVFRTITLPLVLPALSGAVLLTFISGLEAFETPAVLGTPARIFMFTNEIHYAMTVTVPADIGRAMTLGVWLVVLTLLLVAVQWRLLGRRSYASVTGKGYRPKVLDLGAWRWPAFALVLLYALVAVVLPIGQIFASSFFKVFGLLDWNLFTLDNYREVLADPLLIRALRNTLFLAVVCGVIVVFLSGLVAYVVVRTRFVARRVLEMLSWLPWTLPGIVLSLAMLWAYIRVPGLYGTILILLVAYVTHGLPIGTRALSGTLAQLSMDLEESARVSGASWWTAFRCILLALLRPGLVAAWLLLAAMFIRTLSIPVMLMAPGNEVLSVLTLQFWDQGQGQKVAVLAMLMLALLVFLMCLELGFRRLETLWAEHKQRTVQRIAAPAAVPARSVPDVGG
jgi:iron(III) transport system permease protein